MRKYFLIILAFLCPFFSFTLEHPLNTGEMVSFEVCQMEDLSACEAIFIEAFLEAYKDFSLEQLNVTDKYTFLKEAFADVYDDVQTGKQKLMVAKKEGVIIGFSGFKPTDVPHQIYISQLAVSPAYWRHGVATQLVSSVFNLYEKVDHLVVIPRRINTIAINFYKKLGFSLCNYMHPGYDPNRYIGYEIIFNQ